MAVTVKSAPFIVLDDSDRIVEVGSAADAVYGPLVGRKLWECFPGAEPVFRPYYETARRTGKPVEFVQYYDGLVSRVRAEPVDAGRLGLTWQPVLRLDVLTLDRLRSSLTQVISLLHDGNGAGPPAERGRLRVIEGAG